MTNENVIEINETNFETEVLKSTRPVLVEFGAAWTLPSMKLDGALGEIASNFAGRLKVGHVKLDSSPNLGLWYGIRSLPTILYFSEGEVRIGIFGMMDKEAIVSQLEPVIGSGRLLEV